MLNLAGVSTRYGAIEALRGVDIEVRRGEIVTLIGANGAGKSTLLMTVCGNPAPSAGRVTFEGQDIGGLPPHRIARLGIAQVPEGRRIFPRMSVGENVRIALMARRGYCRQFLWPAHRLLNEEIDGLLAQVRMREARERLAGELAAGDRKRLEFARALATEPKLLLLDEVLAGLNPTEIREIVPVIRRLCDRGITIMMIEHVMQAVMSLSEHVFVLAEGRIIAEGTPAEVAADRAVIEAYLGHGAAKKLGGGA